MQAIASSGKAPTKLVLGMMLMPLFMALVLPVLFLTAFHNPEPKDMDLTVMTTTKHAEDIAAGLEQNSDGKLHVSTVSTVQEGKDAVTGRQTRAAYDPKTGDLYLAGANGKALAGVTQSIFTNVASESGKTLQVHDLVPLTPKDTMGTGFMYMCMIGMMTGLMTALMMNMFGKHLGVWKQLAVLCGMSVAVAVIVASTTYRVYEVYNVNMVQSMLIIVAMFLTIGVFQLGLARLIGQASALFGLVVFMMLGMPSSGISMPVDMMPPFFRVLNKFHPLGAAGDMMRSNLYFHGQDIANDIIVLATWAVVGVGLLLLGMLKTPQAPAGAPGVAGTPGAVASPSAAEAAASTGAAPSAPAAAAGTAQAATASASAGPLGTPATAGDPTAQRSPELQTQN